MKIINKTDSVIKLLIDKEYIKFSDILFVNYMTDSNWCSVNSNTLLLTYNIHYDVKGVDKDKYVIQYHRQLQIKCTIEDIEKDSEWICNIKQEINNSLGTFLCDEATSYYPLLKFRNRIFTKTNIEKEMASILEAKQSNKPFYTLSKQEKNIVEDFQSGPLQIHISNNRELGDISYLP